MTEFVLHNFQRINHFLKAQESELPFSHKSVVSIAHEQDITCSKTLICTQLFGHVVGSQPMKIGSQPMKRLEEKVHRMIIVNY